jgi:hypothetical protein
MYLLNMAGRSRAVGALGFLAALAVVLAITVARS